MYVQKSNVHVTQTVDSRQHRGTCNWDAGLKQGDTGVCELNTYLKVACDFKVPTPLPEFQS